MNKNKFIQTLLENLRGKFSLSLGIDLKGSEPVEIFKWFLASILFGARISEKTAVNTYKEFEKRKVLSPDAILKTGWEGLVQILDSGGYVRYDFKTATKLLEIMKNLKEKYDGDLNKLHRESRDSRDLEEKIQSLGKGIGEITSNIFLRELRSVWGKAEPYPSDLVILASKRSGLISPAMKSKKKILEELKSLWQKNKIKGKDFADFEASLLRLGKDYYRKGKVPFKKNMQYIDRINDLIPSSFFRRGSG
jgi:endonuclease III